MKELKAYCVAICTEDGSPKSFFDGGTYVEDFGKMKIFSDIQAARQEQGATQRFSLDEVRVIPMIISFAPSSVPEALPPVPAGK